MEGEKRSQKDAKASIREMRERELERERESSRELERARERERERERERKGERERVNLPMHCSYKARAAEAISWAGMFGWSASRVESALMRPCRLRINSLLGTELRWPLGEYKNSSSSEAVEKCLDRDGDLEWRVVWFTLSCGDRELNDFWMASSMFLSSTRQWWEERKDQRSTIPQRLPYTESLRFEERKISASG